MYCNNCGREIPDNSNVCSFCGSKIDKIDQTAVPTPDAAAGGAPVVPPIPPVTPKAPKAKKPLDKKKVALFAGIGAGVLAVFLVIFICIVSSLTTFSLKKYVAKDLTYYGIDGCGSANIEDLVDWYSLNQAIIKRNPSRNGNYYDYSSDVSSYIYWEITSENNGKLKNGDELVVTFNINKDGINKNPYFKKNIKGKEVQEFKFKVENLEEGVSIDVFDAVESVTLDTTRYNRTDIKYKDGYEMEYDRDGIRVVTENNRIKVYGNSFQSFTVYLDMISDNISESSESIRLAIDCSPDAYVDYGIAFKETEADVKVDIISYVKDTSFSSDDLAVLTQKVKEKKATDWNDMAGNITMAKLYYDESSPNCRLAYFVKVAEGYNVIYYSGLKKTGDGKIVDLEECSPSTEGWWGYDLYKTIPEYEQRLTFTNSYDIPLS